MDWERLGEDLRDISYLLERQNSILEAIAKVIIKPDSYTDSGYDGYGNYEYQRHADNWNSEKLQWEYDNAKTS